MRDLRISLALMVLAVSACSSNNGGMMVADDKCAGLGFPMGSPGYNQCVEDRAIRKAVTDHALMTPNHTPDPLSISQQYMRPVSAIVNCTSYAMPGASTVCG